MAKPLNHHSEYMALIANQLRRQHPSASGEVIRATAKIAADEQSTQRYLELTQRAAKLIDGDGI